MNIITYDSFSRFSYSMLELSKIFPNHCFSHESKNLSDLLIEISSEEVYQIICKYFPVYKKFYRSNHDLRYVKLLETILQEHSDLILCPDISEMNFLGDLENKIQFCFTNKIIMKQSKYLVTIVPQFIFEICFINPVKEKYNLRRSISVRSIYDPKEYEVYYRILKLVDENNMLYDDYYKAETEEELYDKMKTIILEGYLPVKNNRLIQDLVGNIMAVNEFKQGYYDVTSLALSTYLNITYKQEVIDYYYNVKNSILIHDTKKKVNLSSSTRMRFERGNINNILYLAKRNLDRKKEC